MVELFLPFNFHLSHIFMFYVCLLWLANGELIYCFLFIYWHMWIAESEGFCCDISIHVYNEIKYSPLHYSFLFPLPFPLLPPYYLPFTFMTSGFCCHCFGRGFPLASTNKRKYDSCIIEFSPFSVIVITSVFGHVADIWRFAFYFCYVFCVCFCFFCFVLFSFFDKEGFSPYLPPHTHTQTHWFRS
jgi:hypothetical protein